MSSIHRVVACGARAGRAGTALVALLCLTGTGVAQASTPAPGQLVGVTMSISGRITDTTTGQGVAGMCVQVNAGSDPADPVATATSTADGSYVAKWKESLSATPERFGLVATSYCGAAGLWQAATSPSDVTLTPEPGRSSASGIGLQAAPGGRIIGKITDDTTGQPVSGVSVSFSVADGGAVPAATVLEVSTAADGSYILGGLPAGAYYVRVNKTEYEGVAETATRSQLSYLADWVHHVPETSSANAEQLSVNVGQTTVVNESIYEADSVTGTVTDSTTGLPVAGASVLAWGGSTWNDTWAYTPGFTNALGQYEISGLGPGTYTICFEFVASTPAQHYDYKCWKDHPSMDGADPVQVAGFGTVVGGIDQALSTTG